MLTGIKGDWRRAPGVCSACGYETDAKRREERDRKRPRQRSLYVCETCGLPAPAGILPPAVSRHPGRVWCSDPSRSEGVALFYDAGEDAFLLTYWLTPFLEGPPQRLTRAELRKALGLRE